MAIKGGTASYTATEQMVVSAARQIRDGDIVYVGVGIPMEAGLLAKRMHAPNCTMIIENGIVRSDAFPLPHGTDTLGSQSFSDQLSGLFHVMCLGQAGHIRTGFLGAGQVDKYGNVNDTCVGDYLKPTHRWPGSGGGNDIISFCRRTIIVLEQSKRRFLKRVDFNTCPGYFDGKPGRREEAGLRPDTGPSAVITDMAEYTFVDRELTLKSVHSGVGVTLEQVRAEVSWDLKVSLELAATRSPTAEELRIYREQVAFIQPRVAGSAARR
jgi:glutaconate CoA-transferase subunit B